VPVLDSVLTPAPIMGNTQPKEDIAIIAQETRLDHADIKELLKIFNKMANKDGKVKKEDLKASIKAHYGGVDSALVNALFNIFDRDGSKEIDFKEFAIAYGFMTNKSLEDVIETSFRAYDLNGDGFISPGEMRAIVLMNAKLKKYIHVHKRAISIEKITFSPIELSNINQDADSMYAMLDVNKDKQISKEEFIATANSNPVLKKKLCDLLLCEENVNIISPKTSKK